VERGADAAAADEDAGVFAAARKSDVPFSVAVANASRMTSSNAASRKSSSTSAPLVSKSSEARCRLADDGAGRRGRPSA
jgi:hypothetical protein